MTVDPALVTRKLLLVAADIEALRQVAARGRDAYLGSPVDQAFVERYLERLIGRMIDVNYHVITGMGHPPPSDYYASFVGFLPSRNPVATIIVVIDSPHARGYFGGPIAGPVFQRIAEATVPHLSVPPSLNAPPPVLVTRHVERPEMQPARTGRDAAIVHVGTISDVHDLPDFRGLSAREALRLVTRIGLTARFVGSGVVTSQVPAAGTPIEPGIAFELRLERVPVDLAASAVGP